MKHPTPEAWMAYLYPDPLDPSDLPRAEAEAHLATCEDCRQQVRLWQATLGILDQDEVPAARRPVAVAAILPVAPLRSTPPSHGPRWWPWALAAGIAVAAAFLAGRSLGPSRAEFQRELARTRAELTRELTAELRAAQQRDLADLATATVNASMVGQRELAGQLLTSFNEARMADRREFLNAVGQLDQRRREEVTLLRDGFLSLVEKTGGAFRETDTRLNALASALPARNDASRP